MSSPSSSSSPFSSSSHSSFEWEQAGRHATDTWVGQDHSKLLWIATERLDKFLSNEYWSDVNLSAARCYTSFVECTDLQVYTVPTQVESPSHLSVKILSSGLFRSCRIGESFGPSFSTHWFKLRFDIPTTFQQQEVHLLWNSESEAMVYGDDGEPMQGLTGGNGHDKRHEFIVAERCSATSFSCMIEMAANGLFGVGRDSMISPPDPYRTFTLQQARLAVFDRTYHRLRMDFRTVYDVAKLLLSPAYSTSRLNTPPLALHALRCCNEVVNVLRVNDRSTYAVAAQLLQRFLHPVAPTVSQLSLPSASTVHAVGHCHIDTAWLWRYKETRRKVARSWSTQLCLMSRQPEFTFTASQAIQFMWLQQDHPHLFSRVRDAVARGQFHPEGGTIVEMDCNLTGPESLVRQFLYGQRFFQRHVFAARPLTGGQPQPQRCDVFFLPDTFGYAAQLPQIVRGAGMKYFLTQKLSWNLINEFPHHTFVWEGISGHRVLTHFPPDDSYSSEATVSSVCKAANNHKQKHIVNQSLMLYGHGDGGGGPTSDMVERLESFSRSPLFSSSSSLLPSVRLSSSVSAFFRSLEPVASQLPVWVGELYLEIHRGTYTSQAAIKKWNRRLESTLRNADCLTALAHFASTISSSESDSTYKYPLNDLYKEAWLPVLINQFHDVLPGSCTGAVVEDALQMYQNANRVLQRIIQSAFTHLLSATSLLPSASSSSQPCLYALNTLGWTRTELLKIPVDVMRACGLEPLQYADATSDDDADDASPITFCNGASPLSSSSLSTSSSSKSSRRVGLFYVTLPPFSFVRIEGKSSGTGSNNTSTATTSASPSSSLSTTAGAVSKLQGREESSMVEKATVRAVQYDESQLKRMQQQASSSCSLSFPLADSATKSTSSSSTTIFELENTKLLVVVDGCTGTVRRIYDKQARREVLRPSTDVDGVSLRLYDDVPFYWDAWDVELYHTQKRTPFPSPCRVEIEEDGPLRATLLVAFRVEQPVRTSSSAAVSVTTIEQRISLSARSELVHFDMKVDWHGSHTLLKAVFPLLIHTSSADYEIQWGQLSRPTHVNTTHDLARFEVCAQRYVHVQEYGYGVAVLNDSKHGCSCQGNTTITLSLLRAPKKPDERADMGRHRFCYAIYPHTSGMKTARVVETARNFNDPPLVVCVANSSSSSSSGIAADAVTRRGSSGGSSSGPLFEIRGLSSVILETVKVAQKTLDDCSGDEDGEEEIDPAALVLRLYEAYGARGRAIVKVSVAWGFVMKTSDSSNTSISVFQCNLLEDELAPLDFKQCDDGTLDIAVDFTPFEIVTLKVKRKSA